MPRTIPKEVIAELRKGLKEEKKAFLAEQEREAKFKKQPTAKSNKPWQEYDSSLDVFEESFVELAPNGFDDYLKRRFGERMGSLVGIELGGPGSNFFGEVEGFKRSLGVTVQDLREYLQDQEAKERDMARKHTILEGDIFQTETVVKAREWLRGEKADFIVERLRGGWNSVPFNLPLFAKSLARWYELLGDKGIMFLQNPFTSSKIRDPESFKIYQTWLNMMRTKYQGIIRISSGSFDAFKIEKQENSPNKIEVSRF